MRINQGINQLAVQCHKSLLYVVIIQVTIIKEEDVFRLLGD